MKLSSRTGDGVVALISIAIGASILALVPDEIAGEQLSAVGDMNSPAFFPIVAAIVMLVCGVALALVVVVPRRTSTPAEIEFRRQGSVFTVMMIFVLFAAATLFVGMIPSAVATILVMAWFLEYRNPWLLVAVAVAVPAAVYLLFERLLLILLPRGMLFS